MEPCETGEATLAEELSGEKKRTIPTHASKLSALQRAFNSINELNNEEVKNKASESGQRALECIVKNTERLKKSCTLKTEFAIAEALLDNISKVLGSGKESEPVAGLLLSALSALQEVYSESLIRSQASEKRRQQIAAKTKKEETAKDAKQRNRIMNSIIIVLLTFVAIGIVFIVRKRINSAGI